jgi:hypothetical protein
MAAPGPSIVMPVESSGSAFVSVIVPVKEKVIVSAPASLFAPLIASRRVQPLPVPCGVQTPSSVSAAELTTKELCTPR